MKEFLRQTAAHYLDATDASKLCFIFPNRRSLVFFKDYYRKELMDRHPSSPSFLPQLCTINDFFYTVAGEEAVDRVHLLLELYKCYSALNPRHEELDDFIFWGDVLLSDFDDVDKYLVDPRQLFTNVADLKDMKDAYSHLTEEQRKAIERFLSHFREKGALKVNVDSDTPGVKERFLQVWDILLPLYNRFNEVLAARGWSYEGMVYRRVAERVKDTPVVDVLEGRFGVAGKFVFVGLNALNECEKRLLSRMRDAGIAEFCWDYSGDMLRNSHNRSSFFMERNVADFPQAFRFDPEGLEVPDVHVLSVPSSVGQAKQLPAILQKMADSQHGGDISGMGIDTAVVLPDEALLLPVLNTLPQEISDVNVTMGYPMGSSAFYSLMNDICAMQMHLRCKDGSWYFYHKQVWAIFSNSIIRRSLSEEERAGIAEVHSRAQYYIPQESICVNDLLKAIFRPVVADPKAKDAASIVSLCDYQREVIAALAGPLREAEGMDVELEFAKEYYQAVGRLRDVELPVLPATYFRLVTQLISGLAVPFKGEPLKGLQVMGPLEMRALDFRNLIILSCNEGMFPRRSVSSSFIPAELRSCFGLPTYEYQDAVWAYYFYRALQRAQEVWLVFDSRAEGIKGGEESRYIKQLELHFNLHLHRHVAKAPVALSEIEQDIEKTAEDVAKLKESYLSVSALQSYLSCPAKFYYAKVKGLSPDVEVAESLDAGMIGNVYHATMQALYFGPMAMDPAFSMDRANVEAHEAERMREVSASYIKGWLGRRDQVRERIRSLMLEELHTFEVAGRNLVLMDVILRYVMKTLERDLELLGEDESFRLLGLEQRRYWESGGFKFKGFIDRIDSFAGEVRVVDYKTGKVHESEMDIDDSNAETVVEKLFHGPDEGRPKIALQLYMYDKFVEKEVEGRQIVNAIYPAAQLFVSPVRNVLQSQRFMELMDEEFAKLLRQIEDLEVPFSRTDDAKTCSYCDFKTICGR